MRRFIIFRFQNQHRCLPFENPLSLDFEFIVQTLFNVVVSESFWEMLYDKLQNKLSTDRTLRQTSLQSTDIRRILSVYIGKWVSVRYSRHVCEIIRFFCLAPQIVLRIKFRDCLSLSLSLILHR